MSLKLNELASLVNGSITGNSEVEIKGLAKIEEAGPGELTFLYLPAYEKYFDTTRASAIIVKPGFKKSRNDISYIEAEDPNKAFFKILISFFSPDFNLVGIDPSASIYPGCIVGRNVALGKNVVIGAGCSIGDNTKIYHNTVILDNSSIGSNCLIFQNVSIREKTVIGNNIIIHPGAVLGSDGFGFYSDQSGKYHKIPQIGNVIIEDDVEIGANVTIDRASLGSTILKRGVKLDNMVQVAHNVIVGEDTVISAQTGISGSTKVGKNCMIAGQVGIIGHIEIADKVILIAQSGVSKGISKPGTYFGSPAKEFKQALKLEGHIRNLPEYSERIKKLEDQIQKLQQQLQERGDKVGNS